MRSNDKNICPPHKNGILTNHCHDGLVYCSAEVVFVFAQPHDCGMRVPAYLAKLQQATVSHVRKLTQFRLKFLRTNSSHFEIAIVKRRLNFLTMDMMFEVAV